MKFSFECYADENIFKFLSQERKIALDKDHQLGQSEVIKSVLVRQIADIGMVDEDPGKTHIRLRDQMKVIRSSDNIEVRQRNNRYLIIIKPELEECFLNSMAKVGLQSGLGNDPQKIRDWLGNHRSKKHETFYMELIELYNKSKEKGVNTFVTEIGDAISNINNSK